MSLWPWRRTPAPGAEPIRAVLSHRISERLQNSRYASGPPDHTLGSLVHLQAPPVWARLWYFNDQPVPWTIDAAALARTAAPDDAGRALDATGQPDPALWCRVTFRHEGADSDPLTPVPIAGGDGLGLTLPANQRESGEPVLLFSDWVAVPPLGRRDGGAGALLLVRTHARDGVRYAGGVGPPDKAIGRLHAGWCWPGDQAWGDQAMPGAAAAGATRRDDIAACHGVQYLSATQGATVVGIGDSIMHSSCSTGEASGFGIRACAMLSSPALPVGYVSEGYPGRNTAGFCANGAWDIEHLRPQVALIQTWSQNEPWTEAMADLAFARAIALADLARRRGCVPILTTAAPVFAQDRQAETHRMRNVARVRQQASIPVLDLDHLWGMGSDPRAYDPAHGCGDGMHPSDAGCHAAALVLAPMLRRILDQAGPPR